MKEMSGMDKIIIKKKKKKKKLVTRDGMSKTVMVVVVWMGGGLKNMSWCGWNEEVGSVNRKKRLGVMFVEKLVV